MHVSDSLALPMHLQTALLRIAQGAIANVIQHAKASAATVTIVTEQDRLHFAVADDGAGFSPAAGASGTAQKSDSFGLQATAERVQQLGGTLSIASEPGRGTTLSVDLLVKENA